MLMQSGKQVRLGRIRNKFSLAQFSLFRMLLSLNLYTDFHDLYNRMLVGTNCLQKRFL